MIEVRHICYLLACEDFLLLRDLTRYNAGMMHSTQR